MQIKKITRVWGLAGAVAAMLAASAVLVKAQDATPAPAPAMTPTDNSAAGATAMPMASDMSTMPMGMMDYHILSNPHFDYVDLQQAKASGLSDNQIATIAKIARKTGMSFRSVSAAVQRGETFPMLATENNLNLADVYNVDKEKQMIANYISVYESIGAKNGSSGGSMMGMDMSAPMADSGSAPMTPAASGMDKPMPMPMSSSAPMATMDIVDTAMAAKNLTTLVKALQAAGLVETLKGAGPFTVFAPNNNAFSRLPAGTLDSLMADPAKLKMVLTYHVIPASVDAATAMSMTEPTSPPTIEGSTLQVTKGRRGKLMINNATVVKADIHATNGIIHIIDHVLLPPMDASGNIIPATGAGTTGTDTTAAPMTPATPPAAPMTPATPAQ